MDPYYSEWLNLTVRWIHVIAGVAWIGASFYFNWLEGNLERENSDAEREGDLWAVHGGGFYHVEKFKKAPASFPKTLHWFKYEAYLTWISGMALLTIVYYHQAKANLIDPAVFDMGPWQASGVGLGTITVGWLIYHYLCKLIANPRLLAGLIFALMSATAYGLCQILSSKGAYIHVGALIGTIMAANVFFVIIPAQKVQVAAAKSGEALKDPTVGQKALTRSQHNNYFTLPLLFIMISHHYPMTYGHAFNWLVLIALSAIGMGVRHYFNLKNKKQHKVWILPAATLAMIALALVTKPRREIARGAVPVTYAQIEDIFVKRCHSCHSSAPTDDIFTVAPNGVLFETKDQILGAAAKIRFRTIDTETMPLANKTQMTKEERELLARFLTQEGK